MSELAIEYHLCEECGEPGHSPVCPPCERENTQLEELEAICPGPWEYDAGCWQCWFSETSPVEVKEEIEYGKWGWRAYQWLLDVSADKPAFAGCHQPTIALAIDALRAAIVAEVGGALGRGADVSYHA